MRISTETDTDSPWWAKALDRWGIATVFALVLLYHVLYGDTRGGAAELLASVTATQDTLRQHIQDMRLDSAENRWYLRALCLNAARDEAARANCVPPSQAR